jgi:hypothetical protein
VILAPLNSNITFTQITFILIHIQSKSALLHTVKLTLSVLMPSNIPYHTCIIKKYIDLKFYIIITRLVKP